MPQRQNQSERILRLLRENVNQWVPLPQILDLRISQYSARIFELRAQGHIIDNHTRHVDGVVHSWFRLTLPTAQEKLFSDRPQQHDLEVDLKHF